VFALSENQELCACQITAMLGLASATVSRHLSLLLGAQLVQSRKDGRWVYFRLASLFPKPIHQWLTLSLTHSPSIKADRKRLKTILSCQPDELCRQQKRRKDVS